jgi:hypothetical protein
MLSAERKADHEKYMIAGRGWETLWPDPGAAMTDHVITLHDLRVLVCAPDGPVLRGDRDAVDVIGEALGREITLVLPVERLDRRSTSSTERQSRL